MVEGAPAMDYSIYQVTTLYMIMVIFVKFALQIFGLKEEEICVLAAHYWKHISTLHNGQA